MAFGPNSTNPRERRAYAHTMIAAARESGELRDLWTAQMAVKNAGDFKKSAGSGFKGAIEGAAMEDEATRVIVETAREVIDPTLTPRVSVKQGESRETIWGVRRSRSFSAFARGAVMARTEVIDERPDAGHNPISLTLSNHGSFGYPAPQVIPATPEGEPDVWQIRHIPDEARTAIASVVATIEVPRMPGERITNLDA